MKGVIASIFASSFLLVGLSVGDAYELSSSKKKSASVVLNALNRTEKSSSEDTEFEDRKVEELNVALTMSINKKH